MKIYIILTAILALSAFSSWTTAYIKADKKLNLYNCLAYLAIFVLIIYLFIVSSWIYGLLAVVLFFITGGLVGRYQEHRLIKKYTKE